MILNFFWFLNGVWHLAFARRYPNLTSYSPLGQDKSAFFSSLKTVRLLRLTVFDSEFRRLLSESGFL